MTTATVPLSRRLAPALVGLSALLLGWNWYLQPQRASTWTITLIALAVLMLAAFLVRRSPPGSPLRQGADSIAVGIVFAGLILASSLALKLASAFGATNTKDLSQRAVMVILGAFFASQGNTLPKTLAPLAGTCDAARVQAFKRFAGWALVLSGLGFAVAWIVLPIGLAPSVSIAMFLAGILLIGVRILRLHRRAVARP